jgi:hypothetical protein
VVYLKNLESGSERLAIVNWNVNSFGSHQGAEKQHTAKSRSKFQRPCMQQKRNNTIGLDDRKIQMDNFGTSLYLPAKHLAYDKKVLERTKVVKYDYRMTSDGLDAYCLE